MGNNYTHPWRKRAEFVYTGRRKNNELMKQGTKKDLQREKQRERERVKKEKLNTCMSVRFQVLTAASKKMAVFWVVVPCSLVEVYRRFRGACCLHRQGDEGSTSQKTAIFSCRCAVRQRCNAYLEHTESM
jgi:hypothetical protein